MSKQRYKVRTVEQVIPDGGSALPTSQPIAVYYRQSTDGQIGNVSTTIQTVDMVAYLKQRGWEAEQIVMIDMDAGISGTKKIDERPGMSLLFSLISEGKIRAVACQDEDRLFRDVTQIQVNIFIEACKQSQVLVLTPSMVYDFAHELMGSFHARQFRFKCEMAAEYINAHVKGKLHRAKRRLLMEGRWAGGVIPIGFMIDTRKVLPDGTKNEHWRRFMPFEAYAEVIAEYFRLFIAHAGNLRATVTHIQHHGPFYPDPQTCQVPEGFKVEFSHQMRRYGNGYCPGRVGLLYLLTNAAYIGHWSVKGVVERWNNHPGIVPVDLFMHAYDYLSPVTFDGQINPNFHPFRQNSRPSREQARPVERPLCAGMIVSWIDGKQRHVGTNWSSSFQSYTYTLWSPPPADSHVWSKTARFVDEAVTTLFRQKLRATFDVTDWDEALAEFAQSYEQDQRRAQAQLSALEQVMENLVASLDALTNPGMIAKVQARYEQAQDEYTRLRAELARTKTHTAQLQAVYTLRENCGPALDNWENLTRDEKIVALHTFITEIEANQVEGAGIRLVIHWRDMTSSEIILPRQASNGVEWLPSESKRLFALVDAHASQIEIAQAFPQRSWRLIRNKVYWERGKGALEVSPKLIGDEETYNMYLTRCKSAPAIHVAGSGERWTRQEEEQLLGFLDGGASSVDLARAFPQRQWRSIRSKITELCGKERRVPNRGKLKHTETIQDYEARTGGDGKKQQESLAHVPSADDCSCCCPKSRSRRTVKVIRCWPLCSTSKRALMI